MESSLQSPEAVLSRSGADEIRPLADIIRSCKGVRKFLFRSRPAESVRTCRDTLDKAYCQLATDRWDGRVSREELFSRKLRAEFPTAELCDLSPIIDTLRSVKSRRGNRRHAASGAFDRQGDRRGHSFDAAGRNREPTRSGRQLHLSRAGSKGGGYRAIIAGGGNAWFPHYYRNDSQLRDGDLVLMDYAPEINYYTSDIGRMWPVNGRYRPWQREFYGFMVEYHKTLLRHIRPGVDDKQILAEASAEMGKTLSSWTFSHPRHEEAARRTLGFEGHLSHPVGMSVHNAGDYRGRPLQPGTVFALDPQMWVPEEQLYIRVEDTVAVTSEGVEVLTRGAPLELDEMEEMMREEGLLQKMPPDKFLGVPRP